MQATAAIPNEILQTHKSSIHSSASSQRTRAESKLSSGSVTALKQQSSKTAKLQADKAGPAKIQADKVASTKLVIEDDELFKAIGGQLLEDETFDYSQWQRTQATHVTTIQTAGKGHGREVRNDRAKFREEKKPEGVIWLESKLRTARHTLDQYKVLHKQFLHHNLDLKDEIEKHETTSHSDMRKLLRKYERFRGGIAALNSKFKETCADAKQDIKKTEQWIELDLAALQEEVDEVDVKLKHAQKELNILVNYKDKEYPLKSLRINELQKELENLKVQNNEESQELQHIVDSEMDKYKKQRAKIHKDIVEKVAREQMSRVHPSWMDMATQNLIVVKEIEIQKRELEMLEEEVQTLDNTVKELLVDPRTNLRKLLFPQLYPNKQKCTPDMDVVLDIPTHKILPI